LVCIRPASRAGSVQAFKLRPAVLRSTDDIKADGGDGRGDLRGGSFGRPVFAGVRGEKLARSRSWPAAEVGVWRAARSRGGWPAGPVKLRRLTGPGAAKAGARSWLSGVAKLAQSAKLPKRVALPAGWNFTGIPERNAGARNWGRHKVGALVEAAFGALPAGWRA
jgi:hypothetical protein